MKNWYVCKVNPVAWEVGPAGVARGTGGKMRAYVGRSQELYTYQQAIKEELAKQNPQLLTGDLGLTIYFWRNTASFTAASGRKSKGNTPDTTNMFKATEDACQKVLFSNDRNNVVTRGFLVDSGPEVEGCVVIFVEQLQPEQVKDVLDNLPEEVYAQVYGRDGQQLVLALEKSNTELTPDDARYAQSDDDF